MKGSRKDKGRAAGADATVQIAEEVSLTIEELAVACRIERTWVVERVRAGLLDVDDDGAPEQWRFADLHLARARCMVSMERQMDANPELAALVADLVEEVRALRARLAVRDRQT